MTLGEWIRIGMELDFCGPPVCATHDGIPATEAEDEECWEGYDPCMTIIRLYEDADMKLAIEQNHSPSQWRKSEVPS